MAGVSDLLPGVNMNFNLPSIPTTFIIWAFVLIAVGMILIKIYRPKMYPILVGIKRRVGNGTIKIFDDGIIKTVDGVRQLFIHKLNVFLPVPQNKYMFPLRMGFFKKWYVDMYLDSNNELVPNEVGQVKRSLWRRIWPGPPIPSQAIGLEPIGFIDDEYVRVMVPRRQEMVAWAQMQRKRVNNRYGQDFMTKYGFIISQGFAVVLIVGVTLVIMNKHTEIAQLLASSYDRAATVIQAVQGMR